VQVVQIEIPGFGRHSAAAPLRAICILMLGLLLAGCGARPGPDSLTPANITAPGAKQVTVYVATNRELPKGGRGSLSYEEVTVSIPPDHKPGQIEWTKGKAQDASASFVVTRRQNLTEAAFKATIAARTKAKSPVGVFVHGYNYSLPEAVFRIAQMAADVNMQPQPTAVLFSWPSDGAVSGYVADKDAASYSRDDLAHVLGMITSIPSVGRASLIGHSMGGWLVMETLRQLRLEGKGKVIDRYDVALAAPDIDLDLFRRQLAVVGPLTPPMTLFVATDDRALDISRVIAGDRVRAGATDVRSSDVQEIAKEAKLRIVDISAVEGDATGHNRFVQLAATYGSEFRAQDTPFSGLRNAGAFVFKTTGNVVSSPFVLVEDLLSD
jgi:esterase/lipase superfamily enzyme